MVIVLIAQLFLLDFGVVDSIKGKIDKKSIGRAFKQTIESLRQNLVEN